MIGNKESYSDLILSISVIFIQTSYFLQKIMPSETHRAPCPRILLVLHASPHHAPEGVIPVGTHWETKTNPNIGLWGKSKYTAALHRATHPSRGDHGQASVLRGGNTPGSSSVCCTKGSRAGSRCASVAPQPALLLSQARREVFHFPPSVKYKETGNQAWLSQRTLVHGDALRTELEMGSGRSGRQVQCELATQVMLRHQISKGVQAGAKSICF